MNETNNTVLSIRLNLIEELLCQKADFRNSYLNALKVLVEVVDANGETNSDEISSALQSVIARINKVPPIL